MSGTAEYYEEILRRQQERTICEEYELHGWATAVTVADPLEILIMIEEEDDEYQTKPNTVKGILL